MKYKILILFSLLFLITKFSNGQNSKFNINERGEIKNVIAEFDSINKLSESAIDQLTKIKLYSKLIEDIKNKNSIVEAEIFLQRAWSYFNFSYYKFSLADINSAMIILNNPNVIFDKFKTTVIQEYWKFEMILAALNTRYEIYLKLGDIDAACKELKKIIEIKGKNVDGKIIEISKSICN